MNAMKLLLNENRQDKVLRNGIREDGHDVEWCPVGTPDREVMHRANRENRILLTSETRGAFQDENKIGPIRTGVLVTGASEESAKKLKIVRDALATNEIRERLEKGHAVRAYLKYSNSKTGDCPWVSLNIIRAE